MTSLWEARLNHYYAACGCDTGAIFLVAAFVLYVAFLALRPSGISSAGWAEVGFGLLVVLVASGVGKALGIGFAQIRLRGTVRALRDRLTAPGGSQPTA